MLQSYACIPPPPPQPFYGPFLGPPGWAGARRELLDFMVQGKINRGRHTDHLAGCHSIQTNKCPPPPSPMHAYNNTYTKMNLSTVKLASETKPNPENCYVCSYVCTLHCAQLLGTILHRTDLIIFPLTLQTITAAPMMSIWGRGQVATRTTISCVTLTAS